MLHRNIGKVYVFSVLINGILYLHLPLRYWWINSFPWVYPPQIGLVLHHANAICLPERRHCPTWKADWSSVLPPALPLLPCASGFPMLSSIMGGFVPAYRVVVALLGTGFIGGLYNCRNKQPFATCIVWVFITGNLKSIETRNKPMKINWDLTFTPWGDLLGGLTATLWHYSSQPLVSSGEGQAQDYTGAICRFFAADGTTTDIRSNGAYDCRIHGGYCQHCSYIRWR